MSKPTLYPFQIEGARLLQQNPTGFALFDEPGLGKTPEGLMGGIPRGGQAIVTTLSGVKEQWARAVKTWRPDLRPKIVKTARGFRWPGPGVVLIMNKEILPPAAIEIERLRVRVSKLATVKGKEALLQKLSQRLQRLIAIRSYVLKAAPYRGTRILADEAHMYKDPDARCTLRFWEMAGQVVRVGGGVFPLTATPEKNHKDELWMTLQCAGLGTRAFGSYDQYVEDCKVPGVVAGKLRLVSIRRRRVDVLPDLPQVTRETRVITLGEELRADLDKIVGALAARGVNLATATLEQIRDAAARADVKDHVMRVRSALATAKVPAALDFVLEMEEAGVPVVVGCCHRAPVDLLSRRKGWARITGDESAKEKNDVQTAFQAGKLRGVAITLTAGGAGIDLFRAWRGLLIDYPWTPADIEQFEGRLARIGSLADHILVTRFVADHPLEQRVDFLIARKLAGIDSRVGMSAVGQTLPEPKEQPL